RSRTGRRNGQSRSGSRHQPPGRLLGGEHGPAAGGLGRHPRSDDPHRGLHRRSLSVRGGDQPAGRADQPQQVIMAWRTKHLRPAALCPAMVSLCFTLVAALPVVAGEAAEAAGHGEEAKPVVPSTVWGILVFVTVLFILWKKA